MKAVPTSYTIKENDVVTQLGVRKDKVVSYRRETLVEGSDWFKSSPKTPIYYTPEAAQKVAQHFIPSPIPVAVEFVPPDIMEVTVVKASFLNKRVIEVQNGSPTTFFVRVHDSTNFVPGMKMRCKKVVGENMHVIVGRCPRYRGRW